ncbi:MULTISPECIES: DUF1989 domain-containing protein [unclassified Bacillus (in: firmicutes)]|uniref:DUF1989 domain-containing protein n=1 Tax=unclassified Bacillus (in: firmicutes) TaxID=185979 RepID=UPI0008E57875|nr:MULTISPECIES: urea carboxylase-associated family protein [unclassified Bacillus (in: firmicutes)]SFB02815.1 hypothetical protein SAMN02799634_104121 [Bacillus sp. UNCCL13]SFQ88985.1 hypothetical protein SAMN04488577_3392 [Bacillus sp. cl95]
MESFIIQSKTGLALTVSMGQRIKIIDVEGQQIADLVAYNASDLHEKLDSVATRDILQSVHIEKKQSVYSNLYKPMLTLIEDTVGKHDLVSPACRPEMYAVLYNKYDKVESCFNNLNQALDMFGVPAPSQHNPFNIFMNTSVNKNGEMEYQTSLSKSGDYVELRAEMDLIIAISACPNEESAGNGFHSTSIMVEIY